MTEADRILELAQNRYLYGKVNDLRNHYEAALRDIADNGHEFGEGYCVDVARDALKGTE